MRTASISAALLLGLTYVCAQELGTDVAATPESSCPASSTWIDGSCTQPLTVNTESRTNEPRRTRARGEETGRVSMDKQLPPPSYGSSVWPSCSKLPDLPQCTPCQGNPGSDPKTHCGLDIHTNWYQDVPNTCETREYFFNVTQTIIAPDGVERVGLIVNGQMPGPAIVANWGDWIVVHVTNSMPLNGTSIHFHGLRQNGTNEMDGVPSITQCALAPGDSQTYRFRATSYGTSWWHSHFAIQTYEGVFGPLIIYGPTGEAKYDAEQMILLQDWSHFTVDSVYNTQQEVSGGATGAPTLDTGLINGLNVWGEDGDAQQTGKRFEMTVKQGSTYRIRIVNAAIAATFKFFIDGHKFQVIAADFTPIVPYETDVLNINTGERYDVLVTFDQPVGNYWMRSDNQNDCQLIVQAKNIKGIVRYEGAPPGFPTTTPYTYADECIDEPLNKLTPLLPIDAGASDMNIQHNAIIGANGGQPNLFKWALSGTTFQSKWGDPSLYQIYHNGTVPTYAGKLSIDVPRLDEWVYVIIESPIPLPHPMHLHGHDFLILAQGVGSYDSSVPLNTKNPPRRDTAIMPYSKQQNIGGYLVIAFQANNPGAWLLHCHIGWHSAMGFALQIVTNLEGIKDTVQDSCSLDNVCRNWNRFSAANNVLAAPWESGV